MCECRLFVFDSELYVDFCDVGLLCASLPCLLFGCLVCGSSLIAMIINSVDVSR